MWRKCKLVSYRATVPLLRPAVGALRGVFAVALITVVFANDRQALWNIVHRQCVLHKVEDDNPEPCAAVSLADGEEAGSAVLKDRNGNTQFLLIPTRRITGIEDPVVGTTELPNYWRDAWAARGLVSQRARKELPDDAIGMAINSADSRSQDQLHIHIDCLRPDVRKALSAHIDEITTTWAALPVDLASQLYRARWIDGNEPDPDPFVLLSDDVRALGASMREETLAVVGARQRDGKEGFILLAYHGTVDDPAHAEDLLDHTCELASK